MEIHLAPEIESQLQQMAISQGKALPQVVEETVSRALNFIQEQETWLDLHRAELQQSIVIGLAELDRGEGIPPDQLDAFMAALEAESE